MLALIDAMNVAYHETESRGFVRRTALGLSFVLQSSKTTSAGSIHVWGALKDLAGVHDRTDDAVRVGRDQRVIARSSTSSDPESAMLLAHATPANFSRSVKPN